MKFEYKDESVTASIEVVSATVRIGLERSKLISDTEEVEGEDGLILYTRKVTYPSLIAASPKGMIKVGDKAIDWPPTFDQFLDLPDRLGNQWFEAVQERNPQWFELPEIDEKKVIESSTGS